MKVLLSIPGDLKTVPMGRFSEAALRQLGCEVVVFNHGRDGLLDRVIRRASEPWFERRKVAAMLALVRRLRPDLFLTIYGRPYRPDAIAAVRAEGARTACWWLDDPFTFSLPHHDLAAAAEFDAYFTNDRGSLAAYRDAGVPRVHWLPVGIDPGLHRPPAAPVEPAYDLLFAGDWHPFRQKVLEDLRRRGVNLAIMGPWQARKVGKGTPLEGAFVRRAFFTPEQMVDAFHRARIVLNLHTWYGRWTHGTNPRLFEAAGCAAFQLCDHKDEIPDLYVPGTEAVLYHDVAELPELIAHWLPREAERRRVAEAAARRTHAEHTYVHRMRALLAACGLG